MRRVAVCGRFQMVVCAATLLSPQAQAQLCDYFELQEVAHWDAEVNENFGISVSMDGDWVVVGADENDFVLTNEGAVFVYRRNDRGTADRSDDLWVAHTELVPWDPAGVFMGFSVRIDGDRIVAGAWASSDACGGEPGCGSGSAYVFRYNGSAWVPEQKLLASDLAPDFFFGFSVSISGGWLVAGSVWEDTTVPATGAAYVFRLDDNGTPSDPTDDFWTEHVKLTTPQGATEDRFGQHVAIGDDRLIVGAPGINDGPVRPDPGSAYVYRRDDNGSPADRSDDQWVYEARLVASDRDPGDYFGSRLALSGRRAIVGAFMDSDLAGNAGSAYIFRRDDNGTPADPTDDFWFQEAKLVDPEPGGGDGLGVSVALHGNRAAVGGWGDDTIRSVNAGSALVFRYVGGQWVLEQKLIASDGWFADHMGISVALDDAQVVVGAKRHDEPVFAAGAAYVFSLVDDCNVNCIPDEQDIADCPPEDLSCRDCNDNGIPDGCEDCNGNGLANSCDIDACPPEDLSCQDCNNNGMPDECDPDCNGDGVPDECDVAAGACTHDCECDDRLGCTWDRCIDGLCTFEPSAYGDADHNDTINVFDLLCVLAGFAGDFGTCTFEDDDISPCTGNGTIDIFDLLAILNAFAGQDPCCGG